ncbi:MAG: NUDIX hydrolase, partial [Caulobacterales bacterium]|nr:NUDIX hydrolase [Caulobacterales bacterium]
KPKSPAAAPKTAAKGKTKARSPAKKRARARPGGDPTFQIIDFVRLQNLGFLSLDRFLVRHKGLNGKLKTKPLPHVNVHRGDAVAALIVHRATAGDRVFLVRQFRFSTCLRASDGGVDDEARLGEHPGWIVELMAGMPKRGETQEEALHREAFEETGFKLTNVAKISTFFPSPGACSERIHLYYAEVDAPPDADVEPSRLALGVKSEGEEIEVRAVSMAEFLDMVARNDIVDAKAIAAAEYVRRHPGRFPDARA